jgi:hypothetical protein
MTRLTQAHSMDFSDASGSHMRISDEQYFRSCVAKERHLAQLLGHQNIEECYETAGTLWAGAKALPQWTRDWGACGPLLAKHRIAVAFESAPASADEDPAGTPDFVRAGETRVTVSDHPNSDRALMVAIVREVIRLLEHHRSARPEEAAPLHPHP